MIGPQSSAEIVLGALLMNLELIESSDGLNIRLFETDKQRALFKKLSDQWEEKKSIDLAGLALSLGNDGIAYIERLTCGVQKFTPGLFCDYVIKLRRQGLSRSFIKEIESQKNAVLLGADLDVEKLGAIIDGIKRLDERPETQSLFEVISGVEPEAVSWLWKNYFPIGRASIISGDPGCGKTFFALDLAGRISRGSSWPDDSAGIEPSNVLYVSVEDKPSDTLRPRLDSLGGDPARVFILNRKYEAILNLSGDRERAQLEKEIAKIGNVRLMVIDPILDFSGETNPNAPEQVRAFLSPLISIAEKFSFALILIAHLNKAQTMSAIYRTSGATSAWLGKCRAGFMIFRDRDDPGKRYIDPLKANLAPEEPSQLCFRLIQGRVVFEALEERVDVDEHLNPQHKIQAEDASFAVKWLREALVDGPVEFKELQKDARTAGVGRDALYRAKRRLNITPSVQGFGKLKTSLWTLPKKEKT